MHNIVNISRKQQSFVVLQRWEQRNFSKYETRKSI